MAVNRGNVAYAVKITAGVELPAMHPPTAQFLGRRQRRFRRNCPREPDNRRSAVPPLCLRGACFDPLTVCGVLP
jgi:hypothetical protein